MTELSSKFNFKDVEAKWCQYWEDNNIFHAAPKSDKKPYTIVIPPPNVTGILHMGHALNNTLQDIMIRFKRMQGFEACWMPGTDHAGIATQNVVEKQLAKEGKTRHDIGREEMLRRLWDWKKQYGDTIIHQLKKIGSSCDWPRTRFTMDDEYSEAVKEVFVRLYEKGLIYRGQYIINWCPRCQTALSDEEAEHKEVQGNLYHLKYPYKDNPSNGVIVATTRPETMLGDTAVAVNPTDKRYKELIGKTLILPLLNREIKIISDEFVDPKFGSGAVKITPAHDPNDFAMGQRHKLEFINIMHPDAKLNANAGPYQGLDRFKARTQIIEALKEKNLLVKIEPHMHAVGHCYRCNTVVEPYLSKQWFVKMAPLAKPALKASQDGKIKFYPDRWTKVYLNWMENIRDWCISRQIWWGHRIPVWTLKLQGEGPVSANILKTLEEYFKECGIEQDIILKPLVEDATPTIHICTKTQKADQNIEQLNAYFQTTPLDSKKFEAFPNQHAKDLARKIMDGPALEPVTQDPDVLDTWFSSWLWPFATFGWPQSEHDPAKKKDVEFFYPGASLFTASEIIFFWVSRMIMAGIEFRGEVPFKDIYIHGTVRDAQGRKMSKSLGNAIDPLEIINEYGADALRFSLIINSGQDLFISKEKFEIGRNFANKIWNASRLILMNVTLDQKDIDLTKDIDLKNLDLASRWIISKFNSTLKEVTRAIEQYRFSEAETLIYEFFWKNFCDWYLEIIKSKWSDPTIQKIAFAILEQSVRMMHPFIPFVTEELGQYLKTSDKPVTLQAWPTVQTKLINEKAEEQMQILIDIVTSIRNLRAQWNIKPNQEIECHFAVTAKEKQEFLRANAEILKSLAKISHFTIEKNLGDIKNSATGLVDTIKFSLPLGTLIDVAKEKETMTSQIAEQRKLAGNIAQRLKNEDFVSKAPKNVVDADKARLQAMETKIKELESTLKNLG